METFDRVFDRFFGLRAVVPEEEDGHSHAHDDLSDDGELEQFTLSDNPGDNPEQGHSHGKPSDLKEYFDPEDMAQQYNLHQEANRLDMSALTDEIVLSNDTKDSRGEAARVQLSTEPDAQPGQPRRPDRQPRPRDRHRAERRRGDGAVRLAGRQPARRGRHRRTREHRAPCRAALAPLLEGLPERLRDHLQKLLSVEKEIETREIEAARAETLDEAERADLEESLRRLLRSLHGAPRPEAGDRRPGRGRRPAHDAREHEVRRRAVPPGDGAQGRGPAAAAGALRRLPVGAQHRPLHPAPRAQPAVRRRPGAQLRVRQGPGRDHRPVRRAPHRGRAVDGAGRVPRRRDARRRRGLRLRHGLRAVPGAVRLGRHPSYDAAGARRRPRQRQRPAGARCSRSSPGGRGRPCGSPPSRATPGGWAGATCRPTRSTATGCRSSATCTGWRRRPRRCRPAAR